MGGLPHQDMTVAFYRSDRGLHADLRGLDGRPVCIRGGGDRVGCGEHHAARFDLCTHGGDNGADEVLAGTGVGHIAFLEFLAGDVADYAACATPFAARVMHWNGGDHDAGVVAVAVRRPRLAPLDGSLDREELVDFGVGEERARPCAVKVLCRVTQQAARRSVGEMRKGIRLEREVVRAECEVAEQLPRGGKCVDEVGLECRVAGNTSVFVASTGTSVTSKRRARSSPRSARVEMRATWVRRDRHDSMTAACRAETRRPEIRSGSKPGLASMTRPSAFTSAAGCAEARTCALAHAAAFQSSCAFDICAFDTYNPVRTIQPVLGKDTGICIKSA
jgi:hypothetical protein